VQKNSTYQKEENLNGHEAEKVPSSAHFVPAFKQNVNSLLHFASIERDKFQQESSAAALGSFFTGNVSGSTHRLLAYINIFKRKTHRGNSVKKLQ